MYRTILVPVDGSERCEIALDHAVALAGDESEVLVIEVVPVGIIEPAVQGPDAAGRSETEQHLEAARERLHAAGVAAVSSEIVEGSPGPAIVEYAAAHRADVIVIASHGRGAITRALLGSVSEYVARH